MKPRPILTIIDGAAPRPAPANDAIPPRGIPPQDSPPRDFPDGPAGELVLSFARLLAEAAARGQSVAGAANDAAPAPEAPEAS